MINEILGFVSGTISPVTNLIDNISTTKEEKMTLKAEIMKIQNSITEKYIEMETKINDAKGKIMVAELQQQDKYTKRARPTIVYAGLAILFINHVLLPWWSYFSGNIPPSINLPSEFWLAWGGVCGVYAFSRGKEKIETMKMNGQIDGNK